jgi:hypothetical protein
MSVMRCPNHTPRGRTRIYVASVEPVGYPHTALVCGSRQCDAPALIWLESHEKAAFDRGERVFETFASSAMRVRAA